MLKQVKKSETVKSSKPNIYLFHGDDDYSVAKKTEQWIEVFLHKHSAQGIIKIDANNTDNIRAEFLASVESGGLFTTTRLIIVRDLFAQAAAKHEGLVEILENIPAETYIIFAEFLPIKKALKLSKKIVALESKGKAKIQEFTLPIGLAVNKFIKEYVISKTGNIADSACERLAQLLGRDQSERVKSSAGYKQKQVYNLWQVTSELNKLLTFKQGKEITVADVEALVAEKVDDNVFAFTDALGKKQVSRSLKLLSQLLNARGVTSLELQSNAILIVGAISSQFRSMLLYKQAVEDYSSENITQVLDWNPYRARAVGQLASNFELAELEQAINSLLKIDLKLKSEAISAQVLLSKFVMKVTQSV